MKISGSLAVACCSGKSGKPGRCSLVHPQFPHLAAESSPTRPAAVSVCSDCLLLL